MRPVNLFLLSRPVDNDIFPPFEGQLSLRNYPLYPHEVEPPCIRSLVHLLFQEGLRPHHLDGFFYSYIIPQIGKEFDLLRLNEHSVLNIELKSRGARKDKILRQLLRNKYYFGYLQREMALFTYVHELDILYQLQPDDSLAVVPFQLLAQAILNQSPPFPQDISSVFHPADFLVSPLTAPQKFLADGYFLTPQQESFELDFLATLPTLDCHHFFGIIGGPGTGKTLLLYDFIKKCVKRALCCVIHCGTLSQGHQILGASLPNLTILSIEDLPALSVEDYEYLFIDECHRMTLPQFAQLEQSLVDHCRVAVCAFDPGQVLSATENTATIEQYLATQPHYTQYQLSHKLRATPEITSFIHRLMDLNSTDIVSSYPSITIYYSSDTADAQLSLDYFKEQGYTFLSHPRCAQYGEGFQTQQVIGQEFDQVVMILDSLFYYDKNDTLKSQQTEHSTDLYHQFLYLGLTRVREKLAIIVVDNPPLLEKILSIMD